MIVATANLGRHYKRPSEVRTNLLRIRRGLPSGKRVALCLQEIDENDLADEHAILERVLDRWTFAAFPTRVPIAFRGQASFSSTVHHAAEGVPHWSPHRVIPVALVPTAVGVTAVIGGHYPAGAYNGHRPASARTALTDRWDTMVEAHQRLIQKHLDGGHDVVWAMDTNRVRMPQLHDREQVLVAAGVDHIRAIPAPGHRLVKGGTGRINLTVDSHDAHWARVRFA